MQGKITEKQTSYRTRPQQNNDRFFSEAKLILTAPEPPHGALDKWTEKGVDWKNIREPYGQSDYN